MSTKIAVNEYRPVGHRLFSKVSNTMPTEQVQGDRKVGEHRALI